MHRSDQASGWEGGWVPILPPATAKAGRWAIPRDDSCRVAVLDSGLAYPCDPLNPCQILPPPRDRLAGWP